MNEQYMRKNNYFLQTMLREIPNFDVVSFDAFDTLLIRDVLHPQDIFKLLSNQAREEYGIQDFYYIRTNLEKEIRELSGKEDISLDEIYTGFASRYPDWPVGTLKSLEIKLENEHIHQNPLAKKMYDCALDAGKQIWIITDMYLPAQTVENILIKCGYVGYEKLYISSVIQKTKMSGNLYRHILDETAVSPSAWLHIGDNLQSDVYVPQTMGITTGYLRSPRDWFFLERKLHCQEDEAKAGHTLPTSPLNNSIEFSIKTAAEINTRYTTSIMPKEDIVITVDHVSMMFNMSKEKVDNLKEYIVRLLKRQLMFQEFWALKDISFNVRRGERVGLIGLNGSGKSTMLKVVSGVMKPTKGTVSVKGSIAPLIELGAGFDFELSARENVFLNGAVLGYGRTQMARYYENIIDFSELHEFQDVAIKNFSSGMIARLGFAIATCHVPDILIVDEILSVGDFEFQKKCHRKIDELTSKGATVLFVSHSAEDIISICDRAIWLDHGNLVAEGEAQYIVEKYLNR